MFAVCECVFSTIERIWSCLSLEYNLTSTSLLCAAFINYGCLFSWKIVGTKIHAQSQNHTRQKTKIRCIVLFPLIVLCLFRDLICVWPLHLYNYYFECLWCFRFGPLVADINWHFPISQLFITIHQYTQ